MWQEAGRRDRKRRARCPPAARSGFVVGVATAMSRSTPACARQFRHPGGTAGMELAGPGNVKQRVGAPRARTRPGVNLVQASASAVRDTGPAADYERFRAAVARAQLKAWLPSRQARIIDISGPGATAAETAACAGHTVLRVIGPGTQPPPAQSPAAQSRGRPVTGPAATARTEAAARCAWWPPTAGGSSSSPTAARTASSPRTARCRGTWPPSRSWPRSRGYCALAGRCSPAWTRSPSAWPCSPSSTAGRT